MWRRLVLPVLLGVPSLTLLTSASAPYWQIGLALLALAAGSHLATALSHPGRVPDAWRVPDCPEWIAQMCRERKPDGRLRFDRKSGKYKPDRAHYCHQTGELVLMLDHFSPWHRTAIGFCNKKPFVLAYVYTWMLAAHAVAVSSPAGGLAIAGYVTSWLLLLPLSWFVQLHLRFVLRNLTTIEYYEKNYREAAGPNANPYDVGIWRNLQTVLGANPLLWPLPVGGVEECDGLCFARNDVGHTEGTADDKRKDD